MWEVVSDESISSWEKQILEHGTDKGDRQGGNKDP